MSRIGRLPVAIPAGVTVEVAENNVVTVKGPKVPCVLSFCPDRCWLYSPATAR